MLENIGLKHKIEEINKTNADYKLYVKAMKKGSKEDLDNIKLMFMSKKSQLVEIINTLKNKLNSI